MTLPVIINEFEVVAEPPTGGQGATEPPPVNKPATTGPTPHDIERVIRRQKERSARVRAH